MRIITAVIFLAAAALAIAEPQTRAFSSGLEAAVRSYRAEKFDDAHAALDQFEKTNRSTAVSLDLRGCIYMEQGNFDAAAKAFDDAHKAEPSLFLPRLHEGDLLLRQKQYARAREVYEALLKETNILTSNERLRFAMLMTYLGEHDEAGARKAFARITFPTQTPAYYYAQAAWAFAHAKNSEAGKWIKTATTVFEPEATSWFARSLYDLGWIKKKPVLAVSPS